MAGRTTGNKRQREMLRKERQAQKLTRRDERRTRPVNGDGIETIDGIDMVDGIPVGPPVNGGLPEEPAPLEPHGDAVPEPAQPESPKVAE